jgi:hypothetical protein
MVDRGVEGVLRRARDGEVDDEDLYLHAVGRDWPRDRGEPFGIGVDQGEASAVGREATGECGADAAAGPGDERSRSAAVGRRPAMLGSPIGVMWPIGVM